MKTELLLAANELKKVKGLGPKAFEQSAGFLRIAAAKNPLDNSAVHPESYGVVKKMAKDLGLSVDELVGAKVCFGKNRFEALYHRRDRSSYAKEYY